MHIFCILSGGISELLPPLIATSTGTGHSETPMSITGQRVMLRFASSGRQLGD
jgi:hypothetical protein